MKKKNRRFFLSLALVLMMLVNLFPLGIVHAGGTGDKTLVLTDLVAAVSQGGTAIAPGGTLTSTEPITIEISFGVPVEGDDPTPADPVKKGDYAILNLSEAFSLASGSNIELKTGDGTLVGHVNITRDGDTGMVVAQVTFDGEDSVFDGTSNTVSCGFTANFEYDDSGEAGNPGDYEVIILEKTYTVNVPPLEIIYEVTKSGSADLANKQITWEVLLAATQGGEPIDLAGYIFSDDLAAVGTYVDGSFTVGGTAETPIKDGSKISYVFPDNFISPQTITFKTEISDDAYYAASQQNVTNKAQLLDSEEEFLKEGEITVTFTPQWIAKTGLSSDSGSSGDYDPKNRTITWTIIANQMEAALQNVVITDVMPGGLEFGSAYWEKWDSNEEKWIDKNEFAAYPAEGKYELGDISTRVRLTIVTSVPDEEFTAGETTYTNNANISWDGLPGEGPGPGDGKDIGVGYVPISKSGEVKDTAKGIITWTVTVDPKGQTIPNLKVYDLLVYGSSEPDWDDVVFSTGIDAAIVDKIKDSTLTPRFDQKYIENTFDGTPLILKVHPITLEGKRVADLLEITGFDKDKASFTFQSRITNPDIFAGNKNSTMVNTAALFSGSTRLNMASGSVTFVSKTLAKEMLKRGHLDDPAAGVNDYTTSAGEGFDYKDKSVIFRLSINADGIDFTGMEDAAGNILGKATVTDTLPAGWEFVDIVSGSAYLIFKGEKSGNTVKATGAPLDPGTLTGFKAAFNAAERKATFTFDALDQPYVILLKAKPDNDALAGYFDGNKTTTRRNDLSLKTESWTPGVSTHRDVTIVSRILDKTLETPEDGVLEDGELKWIVEYRPYDLPGGGTRLIDKLPEGLELRTDSGGALLLDGNITAHELTLNSDGSYSEGDEVTLIIGENITYNNAERELTFYIPDQSKAYRFTYLTDITGESGELTNRVVLCGKTEEQEKKSESYVITERDGWATMLRNGWIEIKKVDGSTGEFLKGAEFTLYSSDGETVLRKGFTGADGTLKFKVIPDGEYILKETAVPDGYSLESVSHFLIVTTTGDEVVASIDGREGEGSNLITIYNHLEGTVGNLTIKKTVAGNGADETKAFEFTVSFKLPPGTAPDTLYSYVGEGVPGGQIKSGDTLSLAHGQSITITGLPKGTEYTVSEGDYRLEGYVTAADGDETGTIVADETAEVNYTNTRNVGSLTISKTVAGNAGDEEKEFEFTVTFDPPEGMSSTYPYTGFGLPDGTITSGGTLSLAHGQSITITDLPAGTGYTVSEGDYRLDGYVTAADGDENGTIVTDETEEVSYTNTRNVGSLTVSKTVAGNAGDKEKEFEFTVTFDPPEGMSSTYPYTGFGLPDGTITSGGTLSLAHGQSITITDLPAGTGYTVSEGDYRLEGYVTVADGDENGIIVTDETAEVNYTNTRNVGSLTVSKTVAGNAGDEEKEFAFILTFDPSEGMPDSYPYSGEGISAGAVITSGDTITLAHGQSITITEIPEGTEYGVTEEDYTDEGYVTTAAGTTGVITAGDDDDGLPEYFAEFTNTRNEGHLVIRKTVAGALGDKERPFTFVVYFEASGGYRYWGSKTGTIESGQAIILKHGEHIVIEGLLAGTSYRVTEVEANQEGYCTTYTGIVGEITTSGRTADFVNTKIDLPRTGAGGLNTIWGMLLLSSLFLLFTAGGLFLVFPDRRSGQ